MIEKYYPVIQLAKEDLRWVFANKKNALRKIEKLTDSDMRALADKIGDALIDTGYWQVLEEVFRDRFLREC